jgi:hypothetical protein
MATCQQWLACSCELTSHGDMVLALQLAKLKAQGASGGSSKK